MRTAVFLLFRRHKTTWKQQRQAKSVTHNSLKYQFLLGRTYTTKVSNTMYHQVVFQVSICDKMRWKTYTIQKLLTLQQDIFKFNYYVFNEQFLWKPCDVRARNLTPCLYLMNPQNKLSNNAQIKMNTYFNSSKISTKSSNRLCWFWPRLLPVEPCYTRH